MTAKHLVACCLVLAWAGGAVIGQDASPKPAPMSKEALNEEQLAVYRAVLAGSIDEHMPQVNLAERTVLLDVAGPSGNAECGKGMDLEPLPTAVHQLKRADFAQLGKAKIRLVEPEKGRRDAANNDPGRAIRGGTPVDAAVEAGYAHGLFTLSEIRFDKKHLHAIVAFNFECGGLCGHGETLILEKTKTGWKRSGGCSTWMS